MAVEDEPQGEERELDVEHPGSEAGREESVLELHEPIAREKDEPRDGYEPLQTWLVFVFFAVIGWGGWYLGRYSAEFRRDVFRIEDTRVGATAAPPALDALRDPKEVGAAVYQRTCAPCHQANGEGLTGSFPPLAGADYVTGEPTRLVRIVLDGLEGPIEVGGVTYSGVMPAWGKQLDDFEVAAVVTHVRTSFGNAASESPEAFVAEVREASGTRERWRAEELEAAEPIEMPALDEAEEAAEEGDEDAIEAPAAGEVVP
jgi:mono/diheme cytochrome c family protein